MRHEMNKTKPARVSRENRCPVCGKSDWCMIGDAYVLCMRVQSETPKTLHGGEVGWLHKRNAEAVRVVELKEPKRPILNVKSLLELWRDLRHPGLAELSANLGVSMQSLIDLDVVHAPYHKTWAFPMRTGDNSLCGIRLRNLKGDKWAERGSHQGLFIPQKPFNGMVLIVEGPTDCASAVTLGYYAIGRPSCSGGVDHLKDFIQRNGVKRALIVSDLDDPGMRGSKSLQELLPISTAILMCPAKDIRTFVNNGGSREMMDAMVSQLMWRRP